MELPSLKRRTPRTGQVETLDPIERLVPLGLKLFGMLVCSVLLVQALDSNATFPPSQRSLLYSLYSVAIIIPVHEGGHFLFRFFGYVLHLFGGSFWQVMIPLLLFVVALRERSFWATIWLTLAGVHMIDLSPYIYDAPYRSLPLLGGGHVLHDWHSLLIHYQALDWAEPLADVAYYGGGALGIAGVVSGVVLAIVRYMRPARSPLSVPPPSAISQRLAWRPDIAKRPEDDPFGGSESQPPSP